MIAAKWKPSDETKKRILNAAREVFTARGFEKSRMDDIAKKAGVTKVMLYYHYKSKENILKEFLTWFLIENAIPAMSKEFSNLDDFKDLSPDTIGTRIKEFIEPNRAIIRLIVTEAINGNISLSVIGPLKIFFDNIINSFEKNGINANDRNKLYIKLFFFQSVPVIFYFLFNEFFNDGLDIDPQLTEKIFFEKFKETILSSIMDEKINLVTLIKKQIKA